MTTLENLTEGQTLLLSAKRVNGGKVQLEFAEIIKNPNNSASAGGELVGLLNASDSRFSVTKARRAWVSGEIADIKKVFGVDCSSLDTVGATMNIGQLNPKIGEKRVRIQIVETVTPTEYQAANIETTAKKAGSDGDFITHGGKYIFSNAIVIAGEAKHVFLKADVREGASVSASVSASESVSELAA